MSILVLPYNSEIAPTPAEASAKHYYINLIASTYSDLCWFECKLNTDTGKDPWHAFARVQNVQGKLFLAVYEHCDETDEPTHLIDITPN